MTEQTPPRSAPDVGGNGTAALAPILLTIAQAAQALALGRTTLYRLIAAGEIEVVHVGRSCRVPVDALDRFVTQQRAGAAGSAVASATRRQQ